MSIPRTIIPTKRRVGRKSRSAPATLVLVHATYSPSPMILWLYFDRPIDVSAIDGSQIFLDDGDYNEAKFDASGGVVAHSATIVQLQLVVLESYTLGPVRLSASARNGVVAVNDGGIWPGVQHLALPFPTP